MWFKPSYCLQNCRILLILEVVLPVLAVPLFGCHNNFLPQKEKEQLKAQEQANALQVRTSLMLP